MAEGDHGRISFGVDRATRVRNSFQPSVDAGDGYDLTTMGVADGFRPTAAGPAGSGRITSRSSQRQRRSTPPPRPSSATKPRNLDSPNGGAVEALPRSIAAASTSSASSITRSSSSSTDQHFARAESPYQGPAGPSHPYHMYTQNTRLARTASIATTSTIPAVSERSYNGPSGPTHPYQMYSQNIVAEGDSLHDGASVFGIPAGFPDHGGAYQRRLGPDGEEAADMIGPLGHTEQLPPYTRYPENVMVRKATPVLPYLPGAGGIGLATRNPEFASRDDLTVPLSNQTSRHSMTSDSGHQINATGVARSEKPPERKWKTFAKKKICGIIPLWVLFLVGVIVLGLIILGAVLAVISHRRNSNPPNTKSSGPDAITGTIFATVTTTYDASPMATTPSGIPALPTGTFILPIVSPSFQQSTCLDKSTLYEAWSCDLPPNSIEMTVTPLGNSASNGSGGKITISGSGLSSPLYYGSQPPKIEPNAVLNLVNDAEQTRLGPAWYFQGFYDKIVVIPEEDLPSPSNYKRDNDQRGYGDRYSKAVAQDGDRPWFCHWGGTILETFIYVNQTSDSGNQQAAPTTTTSTYKPATTAKLLAAAVVPRGYGSKYQPSLENYPNKVKVEERRDPNDKRTKAPYCLQMVILPDGSAGPSVDEDGSPIIIYLNETEPSLTFLRSKRAELDLLNVPVASELLERGDTGIPRMCRCVWFT